MKKNAFSPLDSISHHAPTYDELRQQRDALCERLKQTRHEAALGHDATVKLNDLLADISEGYCETDLRGRAIFSNDAMGNIVGHLDKDFLAKDLTSFFELRDARKIKDALTQARRATAPFELSGMTVLCPNNPQTSVDLRIIPQRSQQDKKITGFRIFAKEIIVRSPNIASLPPVTPPDEMLEAEMEKAIERANLMAVEAEVARIELNQIFNTAADGMWVVENDFTIRKINHTLLKILGKKEKETIDRKCYEVLASSVCRRSVCPMARISAGQNRAECDLVRKEKNGGVTPFIMSATPFRSISGERIGIVETFKNISDRKQMEAALQAANEKLERLASVDGLTQIANRRRFDHCFERDWQRMVREQLPLSLLMCDVDYFKLYNDYYGHQSGDDCLCRVAKAIDGSIKRPADLVARYGGEEFVVILPNTPLAGALSVAETILDAVRQLNIPHATSLVRPHVTLSVGGASLVPNREMDRASLIQLADEALYKAKESGRNRATGQASETDSN